MLPFFIKISWNSFGGTVFVFCILLSQVINESSIMLCKYLPFSQQHLAGFQI